MTWLLDGMPGTTSPLALAEVWEVKHVPPGIDASRPGANEIMRRQQLR